MMINIDPAALDDLVLEWLKHMVETLEYNQQNTYVHPDDVKAYKRDIKAAKQLIDYVGDQHGRGRHPRR